MYSLLQSLRLPRLLSEQLPIVAVSIIIAEIFYKFHSFTLECLAFLATWFVLDAFVQAILGKRA
ncbi:MAG: hypothetical protein R2880_10935 [Deinococcales bacterium]